MADTPEITFYKFLDRRLPWFLQRIETTTASGVPDVWAAHKGRAIWIELKACTKTNVQIRAAQHAWISKAWWNGVPVLILNRNPKRPQKIQLWQTPYQSKPGRAKHLKLINKPNLDFHSDDLEEVMEKVLKITCS